MTTIIFNGAERQPTASEIASIQSAQAAFGSPKEAQTIPISMLRQRVEKLGLMDDFSAYLFQYPPLALKLLSLENGVDPADPSFAAAFTAMQIPQVYQDYILAPASAGVPEAPANG